MKKISSIISYISQPVILAFKDINSSIQTSLYDLFNKNFNGVGEKRYCRISIGSNSNSRCFVDRDFKCILYIRE
jgi:hypothetical protein